MKIRNSVFFLVLFLLAAATCFAADDALMGTWKLNESKSKIAIDGTAADGTSTHSEWTGKFDGKDYPSTGNPNEDMRSAKTINDRNYQVVSKKGGKVVLTAHVVVAPDGKSRTVTTHGTNSKGEKYRSVAVYDKQ
jgi:hypothetical protein